METYLPQGYELLLSWAALLIHNHEVGFQHIVFLYKVEGELF